MFDKIIHLDQPELAAYRELRLRGLIEHPEAFSESADHFREGSISDLSERLAHQIDAGGFTLLALSGNGALIGTVSLAVNQGEKTKHRAQLWGMYVVPEARGQSVAQRLIEELVSQATNIGTLEQIWLGVVTTNRAAFNLYNKAGFAVYATEPRVIRIDQQMYDQYLMIRYLG